MFRYLFFLFILLSLFSCGRDSQFTNSNPSSVYSDKNIQTDGSIAKRGMAARYVPGEVLVKFKTGTSASRVHVLNNALGAVKIKEIEHIGVHRIKLPHKMSVEDAVKYYKAEPDVEYAEPNYIVKKATIPNDPDFSKLWGLNNTGQIGTTDADIDAPEAWDITTGSNDVIIAVIDTGVAYNHPDLAENIWINTEEQNGTPGSDDDGNGYIDDIYGWDFIDNDGYPEDYDSHGTHVSGTIAAKGNNEIGIAGVMWLAKIMPIRFLGVSGWGDTGKAAEAIVYAADNGARIINASWGSRGYSQALYEAIEYAQSKNVLFVAAAGNEGNNNDTNPFYPASYNLTNIISVAATDYNDKLASFSNYGANSVDLAAPGVDIYSSIPLFIYDPPITVYSEKFDSASGELPLLGWSRGGTNSTWAVTTGTGIDNTNSLEDSPGGDYLPNTNSWAGYMTPITSVKNNRYTLSFKWRGHIDPTIYDYLDINYSPDGINWDWADRTNGNNSNFTQYITREITAAADFYNSFYFGFGLESDSISNYDGVYIDDVVLTREPISISGYNYESYGGTSMVAPHVSGVAGLILSLNPGLSYSQVKDIILNTVDTIPSLSGITMTGGRVNAMNALQNALPPTAPGSLSASAISSSQIDLSWTDNSSNETGFKIERKVDAGGTYSEIATVGANITTNSDTGLSASTTYYYRVSAYNVAGDSSYSNEVSVTTPEEGTEEGKGSGGGACSIGMVHSYQTAVADTIVLITPLLIILIIKRFRKFQDKA
ncbi:MAG: S8 family serine peptidase [Nitrospirota bacterium]